MPGPWCWPGWAHVGYAARLEAVTGAWLCLVFFGAEWLTRLRAFRVRIHFAFEPGLPLVPALIAAYLSIHVVFALVPFALPTRGEVRALMRALAAVIGAAGIGFLLVPADLAYPPPAALGSWEAPFWFADTLNLDHNLVPSLHVALAVTCIAAYARNAPLVGAVGLWAWGVTIAVATVLTHQHHLVDAVTGFALGLAGDRLVYRRLVAADPTWSASGRPRNTRVQPPSRASATGLTAPSRWPRWP